jgi:hypothetical protein
MKKRKAILKHDSLVACGVHDKKRQWKRRAARPTNKCPICHLCWLSDRLETLFYKEDIEDMIKFSNLFGTLKPSSIEYIEEEE